MEKTTKLPLNEIHVLENCCIIEEKCADIYRHFSKLYSENPAITALWKRVASEEDHHADMFRLATRNLKKGIQDIETPGRKLNNILSKLESIHALVTTNRPSLPEAFELALNIEKTLAEFHIGSIVKFADKELSDLFITMEKHDQGHLEMLQNAVDSLK